MQILLSKDLIISRYVLLIVEYMSTLCLTGAQCHNFHAPGDVNSQFDKVHGVAGKAQFRSSGAQIWCLIHWSHASSLVERGVRLDSPLNWPSSPVYPSSLCSGKHWNCLFLFNLGDLNFWVSWCEGASVHKKMSSCFWWKSGSCISWIHLAITDWGSEEG